MTIQDLSGRQAARARREAQVQGKSALSKTAVKSAAPAVAKSPVVERQSTPVSAPVASKRTVAATSTPSSAGRNASRARRQALSERGKAGASGSDRQRTAEVKRTAAAMAAKDDCGCGCNGRGDCGDGGARVEMSLSTVPAKYSSQQRRNGSNEIKTVSPTSAGRLNSKLRRQALSSHGKTGADSYRKGLSAAQMVRQQNPEISGRELARTVRTMRNNGSTTATGRSAPVGRRRPERPGDVTGTRVSHSDKTTGDETGLCRAITGTEYFSSEVFTEFCQAEAPKVPAKVGVTETLRGGKVTSGGKVGRSEKVTGDERGSCRDITGSEYLGREQFDEFCQTKPEPGSAKVSFSQTTRGQIVSGSKPARARQVTGNEAGTCKTVTGTPYAGVEQMRDYCEAGAVRMSEARNARRGSSVGRDITGMQPGLSGITGAEKGACRTVSGTAYIGSEQMQEVCGPNPAQPGESDFPQPLSGAPWGAFSIVPPSHASQQSEAQANVTGTRYEQGRVSGTFSLAEGKVTGTEQFRFDGRKGSAAAAPAPATLVTAEKSSRVTGEGLNGTLKITGDDWDRGDRVTGTEGTSAIRRNPTRRGPVSAMTPVVSKRNEELERSSAKVTGSSGSTEKGAPVTVSGGARG